jgi:hypothetical protein
METGYEKNKNALPVKAGFKKFRPVPPNTSLPITTPNEIPRATCHKGIVAGRVKGNNRPVTRRPSLILCPRIEAKRISQKNPTPYVTIIIGKTYRNPKRKDCEKV